MKHFPLAILGLTLFSALAVLVVGVRLSREESTVVIGDSRTPATNFTASLLSEIEDLTESYERHLLDLREIMDTASSIELASRARNITGIEQVTSFDPFGKKEVVNVERGRVLNIPRASGEQDGDTGILIDLEKLTAAAAPDFSWIDQKGYELHFAARLEENGIAIFRINREAVQKSIEGWLRSEWIADQLEPLRIEAVDLELRCPDGTAFAQNGEPIGEHPSLLLTATSSFGDWKIAARDRTEMVISYRQPILIGAAAVAVMISLAGFLGFFQQQRAVRLAEQRVSFVNRVSHELRTPLTNILLNIDLARDSIPSGDQSTTARRLDLIRDETGRLSRLLENVLTFSRRERAGISNGESGEQPLRLIPCSLDSAIDEVLVQFGPSLERKNLTALKLFPETEIPRVLADPDALNQIVSNLVSNVEKYAAEGEVFEIQILPGTTHDAAVTLVVSDHGPGIPANEADQIFRPFTRLSDTTTEGVSGTGLGLAIARDLAGNMKGTLKLKRRPDKKSGARFELTLPCAAENIVSIAS